MSLSQGAEGQTRRRRLAVSGYALAASLVLVVAAGLRFHGLSGSSLGMDEAIAAVWAQGTFEELVRNTWRNTSPILYPVALWLVQKVEISTLSARLLPASASVFTVFALLFWLPRVGVPRRAALFAGALAALSCAALYEAHGTREYSLDAAMAVLLIVGLLSYVRRGARTLLGLCLFLGPLVQYGLVLFGSAVLVTALLVGAQVNSREGSQYPSRGIRLRAPARLLPPAAMFAFGCAISYLTTLRQQLANMDAGQGMVIPHMRSGYYGGDLQDIASVFAFTATRMREFLNDQLAPPLVAASLLAGGVLFLVRIAGSGRFASPTGRKSDGTAPYRVVGLLFGVSLAVAAVAAVAGIYPLGAGRHGTYLGPVVFTAGGIVLSAVLAAPAAAVRRWPTSAALGAGLCGIAWVGAAEVARRTAFAGAGNGEEVMRYLEEARPEDLVLVSGQAGRIMNFYAAESPGNWLWHYAECHLDLSCTTELLRMAWSRPDPPDRIWIVTQRSAGPWLTESLRRWDEDLAVTAVVVSEGVSWGQYGGDIRLYRIDGARTWLRERVRSSEFDEWAPDWADTAPGTPTIRSSFDVWSREDALVYRRQPCSPADADARFILWATGPSAEETGGGEESRAENLDFDFGDYGIVEDGMCLAIVPLSAEKYARIETGQPSGTTSWRARVLSDRARHEEALRSLARGEWGEPDARADFDLYLSGNELRYFREPCLPADVERRFYLHLHGAPSGLVSDSSADGARTPAYENRDFNYYEHGVILDGRCLAMVPLGNGDIYRIATGQFAAGEPQVWRADLWPGRRLFESRLESVASGGVGEPVVRSTFDLYLDGSAVLFHRASCAPDDIEARFFLHFYPAQVSDLPRERRDHGFLNLDFDFTAFGFSSDGRCFAAVPLPDFAGDRLRAGQFLPGGERLWSAEAPLSSGR